MGGGRKVRAHCKKQCPEQAADWAAGSVFCVNKSGDKSGVCFLRPTEWGIPNREVLLFLRIKVLLLNN